MTTTLLESLYLGRREQESTALDDAKQGLLVQPKSWPPKYFYDAAGSDLFDQICYTPEYYPTRTEDALLRDNSEHIIALTQAQHIVELGSGASRKTVHILDHAVKQDKPVNYWPYDVCEPIMLDAAKRMIERYQEGSALTIQPLVGDYNQALHEIPDMQGKRLFLFLGGTIGNFEPEHAVSFLKLVRAQMHSDDYLLIGLDRVKETAILNAAYNDKQGLTAAFNLNVLPVMNRELEANFDPAKFRHVAFFNEEKAQIEMHLESLSHHQVSLKALDEVLTFEKGERMLTEISRKFSQASLDQLLTDTGLSLVQNIESDSFLYSLLLLKP